MLLGLSALITPLTKSRVSRGTGPMVGLVIEEDGDAYRPAH